MARIQYPDEVKCSLPPRPPMWQVKRKHLEHTSRTPKEKGALSHKDLAILLLLFPANFSSPDRHFLIPYP